MITEEKSHGYSYETKTVKKMKLRTEKVNKLLKNIASNNITELNDLIYIGAKLVSDKIVIPPRNPKRNTKADCEIRREQMKKPREDLKVIKRKNRIRHNGMR